jgi:hypothetical protein
MNIKYEIAGSSILNDLLYAFSGVCIDGLSASNLPSSLHTDVWYPVDFQVRASIISEIREYEHCKN